MLTAFLSCVPLGNLGSARVLNLTPYDAALETTAMKWHLAADKSPMIRSLSVTSVLEHGSYSEQVVAVRLMQDLG